MTLPHIPTYRPRRPPYPGLAPREYDFACSCGAESRGISEIVAHDLVERHRKKNKEVAV